MPAATGPRYVYVVVPPAPATHCENELGELQPKAPGVQGPLSIVAVAVVEGASVVDGTTDVVDVAGVVDVVEETEFATGPTLVKVDVKVEVEVPALAVIVITSVIITTVVSNSVAVEELLVEVAFG